MNFFRRTATAPVPGQDPGRPERPRPRPAFLAHVHFWCHRRRVFLFAVAALGILTILTHSVVSALRPPGTLVLVAARNLPAHHHLTAADVTWVWLPQAATPPAAILDVSQVSGKLRFPLDQQQIITKSVFSPPGQLTAPAGQSIVGIRLRPEQALPPVIAGDRVLLTLAARNPTPGRPTAPRSIVAQVVSSSMTASTPGGPFSSGEAKETNTLWVSTQRNNAATISLYSAQGLVGIALLP